MEEPNEAARVVPELYFLIAKFLSNGPLKETAKTLLNELNNAEVLPRRIDWDGASHSQTYQELASQYASVPADRLARVCARALSLARSAADCPAPRLSLLSESLVRPKPEYSFFKQDHSIVRRLARRELGLGPPALPGGRGGEALFPPRLLSGLQLQRRTLGHLSAVYCLLIDRTGRYVLTGADDLLVKVWSCIDGRLVATLRGAGAEITDICVSADGALLAAGSVERLVRVWCLASAAPRAVLHAHQGTITSVHWAPPSRPELRWLASTSTDGSVAFWTCSPDGQFLSQPVQYVERMRPGACHMICAAWSAGGGFLAAGSADHYVRVYCVDGSSPPRRVLEVSVHGDAVDSISWAHRGLRFVSGSKDGCAALWTLHATQWRHTLLKCAPLDGSATAGGSGADSRNRLKVTMVCWDCSDALVLTACSDCSVRVWCARTHTQQQVLRGHRDEAYVLEAHPFLAGVFLSAGHDGHLFVWHAPTAEVLAKFHNNIEGQGDGAIFDAKWSPGGAQLAASDSHGHLLLLGLGRGHKLLATLPTELFFHTDYRPLVRDALGGALDEQTETPPHLMPPPFLVDVEGAPHPPCTQRLVPGRETLPPDRLVPHEQHTRRSRIDEMIEALGFGGAAGAGEARGVWRGEGVRHTAGSWQPDPAPPSTRPIMQPMPAQLANSIHHTSAELYAFEQEWYRVEMRRRPLMISTAAEGAPGGPRRRAGRRPARPGASSSTPQSTRRVFRASPPPDVSGSESTSDSSVRLSGSDRSERSRRPERRYRSTSDSDVSVSYSSGSSSSSSQYSDWEAGAALAPPARARRKPLPANRYSPSETSKRAERAAGSAPPAPAPAALVSMPSTSHAASGSELPELYRPGEWLCAVSPRKAPYHPQMGDCCLYFRLGHERYFDAVAEKDLYKVGARDKPWDRTHVFDAELVKVVGIKYVIKPPRVVCLRLACSLQPARTITVKYHDMPDVIDFLVLRQQYDAATQRHWGQGDRFRCMIDDSWWTGIILERTGAPGLTSPLTSPDEAAGWARRAAEHFLSLRVRWDNGEVERLSPWDLEPLDPERLPMEPGGCVPVLSRELEAVLYRAEPHEWPHGSRAAACRAIATHIAQVMSLSVAEPFVAPVDLQAYPVYAMVVPYPIDLATIKARFENLFYRRCAAAQFDVRYLASNAEQFNEPHSPIVRAARLVTDLLLHIIANWRSVDVVGKYHELAASYHSSDDEPLAAHATKSRRKRAGGAWRARCAALLRELNSSSDAEPFRQPVSLQQAPDYHTVVSRPMDLGTVSRRLAAQQYADAAQFAADVRQVFANSRLYNTNKRSRIYSMTVRLSALFESLWRGGAGAGAGRRPARGPAARPRPLRTTRIERTNGTSHSPVDVVASDSDSSGAPLADARPRADSWDSDAPLHTHRKGKGVGKKSKSRISEEPEPGPSTSHHEAYEPLPVRTRERERADSSDRDAPSDQASRRRRRGSSSESEWRRTRTKRHKPAHRRERFTSGSSSVSSSSGGSPAPAEEGRYESDRSYRPRYSSDDDAPLLLYRQRQEGSASQDGSEPGPSSRQHNGSVRRSGGSGGVSLRRRVSPRRYNEDSEDDSVAAISKRHHRLHLTRHATMNVNASVVPAHASDHNYFNGHAPRAPAPAPAPAPVSISSRGRVRKLTAKARGLLRD